MKRISFCALDELGINFFKATYILLSLWREQSDSRHKKGKSALMKTQSFLNPLNRILPVYWRKKIPGYIGEGHLNEAVA